MNTIQRTGKPGDIMTSSIAQRSRLAGTLTTPGDTDDTAGVDAFNSTIRHRPDAVDTRPTTRRMSTRDLTQRALT
jgi:hypothetical protein